MTKDARTTLIDWITRGIESICYSYWDNDEQPPIEIDWTEVYGSEIYVKVEGTEYRIKVQKVRKARPIHGSRTDVPYGPSGG